MRGERLFYIVFLIIGALADAGLWGWLLLVDHGPRSYLLLAAAAIVLLWPYWAWRFLQADLEAERGRAAREWSDAGYHSVTITRQVETVMPDGRVTVEDARGPFNKERVWEWHDDNGNGRVDAGEMRQVPAKTTFVNTGGQLPPATLDSLTTGQRARLLLLWCYDRAAQKLGYSQLDITGEWTRALYDESMAILKRIDLIRGGGLQGRRWRLVITPDALSGKDWSACRQYALAVFDTRVVDE